MIARRRRARPRASRAEDRPAGPPRAHPHAHPHPPAVIALREVHKVYRTGEIAVHALRGVTLTIDRGEYVAIMGSSGSGKSTLMNILGCLDLPTEGVYHLDGVDVRRFSEDELADVRNRKIGFVFQSFNLVPRTTTLANVELPLAYGAVSREDRRRRARAALARVGMGARERHVPSELSGGQQQRAAVARAIVTNPALILADEPTGNLDTGSTREVLAVFDEINADGRTVVLITHEDHVAAHARRVIRLSDGLVVSDERQAGVGGRGPA
jgi:putative ABC transport system ATP-binding protein